MRSTNPFLVDRRTETLSHTGHSQTLLAKVRCMGINTLRFSNYEKGAPNLGERSGKAVCC